MKCNEAMATNNKEQLEQAISEELERFNIHKEFEVVKLESVPRGFKMLTSTLSNQLVILELESIQEGMSKRILIIMTVHQYQHQ